MADAEVIDHRASSVGRRHGGHAAVRRAQHEVQRTLNRRKHVTRAGKRARQGVCFPDQPDFSPGNRLPQGRGFLLSTEELATLWHPATATVRAPTMEVTNSRELEPPSNLPRPLQEPDLATLGRVRFRAQSPMFGIRLDDRRRHLAIIGKTGMGKTTLLRKLIVSDMQAGRGLTLIDPHGDLADTLLNAVPTHRTNDVVLFDAGDRDYPLSFNVLSSREANQRGLTASAVVSAFKKLYGDSWGPRLEHILRNSLLALLETPGTSLLSLQRLLSDTAYSKRLTACLDDPVVRTFWQQEFRSIRRRPSPRSRTRWGSS